MEFDVNKVFVSLSADDVKIGSKGYCANSLVDLKTLVEHENKLAYGEVTRIYDKDCLYRFCIDDITDKAFFYLVEEFTEKKFRPYSNPEEMIEDFKKRYNVKVPPYEMPLIWIKIKDTDKKYLVVRFASTLTICHNDEVYTPTFENLVKGYTYLDGSPCGIEEENEKSKM